MLKRHLVYLTDCFTLLCSNHRYLKKVDYSSFVLCPQAALALPRDYFWQPETVLTRQTREAVSAINQSIFIVMSMVLTIGTVFD